MFKVNSTLLLLLVFAASCTQDITINLDKSTPELVVEGAITNEAKQHKILLSKTGDYFQNQPVSVISGALVKLSDGINTITLSQNKDTEGAYVTPADFAGVPGRTYTLNISQVDVDSDGVQEQYQASCPMLPLAPVDSISVEKKAMFRQDIWEVKLSMQDLPKERNFYLSRVYVNGVCRTDSINEWGISNDEFFDGKYLNNETIMFLGSRKPDEKVVNGDKVMLEVCGITEDYMMFIFEVGEEFNGRNPLFGGQPANIRTNVKRTYPVANEIKGARGYFAAYSVGWGETTYKDVK
ncbi:MAG: DUF4249 domain-containing protein [Bacteroidales bacterium]